MKSWVGETRKNTSNTSVGIIKQEFQKGYMMPAIPYQQYGVLTRIMWTTKPQILRIVPGHDPQTGEVFKQNQGRLFSVDEADRTKYLSDTFFTVPVIEKFGDVGPVLATYPPNSREATLWGGETILRRFARDIMYACSDKSSKRDITPTNDMRAWCAYGGKARLSFDSVSLLMQALVFHMNGRNNQNAETKSDLVDAKGNLMPLYAVCALTSSESINRLVNALVEPKDPALPLDAETNNKYGALAELNGNILYLNPARIDKSGKSINVLTPSVQPAGAQGWTPTPMPLDEATARSLWIPWEQLLHPLTMEEQFELCAQEFGADTVNYVIGTDKILQGIEIPEKIRAAGLGRYANLVGGSVTLTSGVPNSVPAQGMPAFNAAGLGPAPASQPRQAAPSMSGVLHGMTVTSATSPKPTGIQNTGTVDAAQVMRTVAAIRASAGLGQPQGGGDAQADAANSLLGALPSEEDN